MTKQPNPNSKRSKRRANRDFKGSRPNRRAKENLEARQKHFETKMKGDGKKPGALKRW